MTGTGRRLVTIGTGSGLAVKGKGGPCHLVEAGGMGILLDCGEGAGGGLADTGGLLGLGPVIITHMHPDHISGLWVLMQNLLLMGRGQLLEIFLPAQGAEPVGNVCKEAYLSSEWSPDMFSVQLQPLEKGVVLNSGGLTVRAWESDHFAGDRRFGIQPRPAYGVTIDHNGSRLIYTGDVSSAACFKDELKGGATLLCDAMHVEWHIIMEEADKSGVRQVIFTHVDPAKEDELIRFCATSGHAVAAQDGMEFDW